jgi:hypothetical protein
MQNRLFILLLLSVACKAQQPVIKGNDAHIHYMGRTTMQNDAAELSWSGNSATINFDGTAVKATLKDQKGENTYNVIVDGKVMNVVRPDTTTKEYTLVSGLPAGKHHLELFKRTEWVMGKTWLYEFKVDGTILEAPETKRRKIEFYGNSITCGYAIEDTTGQDRGTAPYENGYRSYAAITARHFDAEFSSISRSGIGVIISWFPLIMPEMYDRQDPDNPQSKWDFSKYTPDVVVINLFQNDSWLVLKPEHEQFKARFGTKAPSSEQIITAYQNFVQSVRKKYPDATIICALGTMDASKKGSPWFGYIEKAVAGLNDKHIYTHNLGFKGTQGHPSGPEQEMMAKDLIGFIEKNVKW